MPRGRGDHHHGGEGEADEQQPEDAAPAFRSVGGPAARHRFRSAPTYHSPGTSAAQGLSVRWGRPALVVAAAGYQLLPSRPPFPPSPGSITGCTARGEATPPRRAFSGLDAMQRVVGELLLETSFRRRRGTRPRVGVSTSASARGRSDSSVPSKVRWRPSITRSPTLVPERELDKQCRRITRFAQGRAALQAGEAVRRPPAPVSPAAPEAGRIRPGQAP